MSSTRLQKRETDVPPVEPYRQCLRLDRSGRVSAGSQLLAQPFPDVGIDIEKQDGFLVVHVFPPSTDLPWLL